MIEEDIPLEVFDLVLEENTSVEDKILVVVVVVVAVVDILVEVVDSPVVDNLVLEGFVVWCSNFVVDIVHIVVPLVEVDLVA